jgi:hypothetical protein
MFTVVLMLVCVRGPEACATRRLTLVVTLLRSWVRLGVEKRNLTLPDYLVWGGWLCVLGWFICSIVSLQNQVHHPLVEPDLTTDSVTYLVVRAMQVCCRHVTC